MWKRSQWRWVPGFGLGGLFVLTMVGCGMQADESGRGSSALPVQLATSGIDDGVEAFLARHWPDRIPPQGPVPKSLSLLEASLAPQDCGQCHRDQYADWQSSRHRLAMGPGVLGQLVTLDRTDPEQARACRKCHTPLAEQQAGAAPIVPFLNAEQAEPRAAGHKGLTCAGCHVRGHRRFGPPRAANIPPPQDAKQPHDGFVAEPAFMDSRFCRGCHQFGDDGYALNGKPLENTYNEWSASDYARQGVQCQDCHMPGRRHLWRGVHDPDMMRQAVKVDVSAPEATAEAFSAKITITNIGAGHYFPTYATPSVVVRARLIDDKGATISDTIRESVIGRQLSLDLKQEVFDTRIPPKDHVTLTYDAPLSSSARALDIELLAEPDDFYSRFYAAMLAQGLEGQAKDLIEAAARQASASGFSFYHQQVALDGLRPSTVSTSIDHAEVSELNDAQKGVDWNDARIHWYGYEQGLELARKSERPAMLIFYADWCPTCHAYQQIFADGEVLELSKRFVMIRVNVEQRPRLSGRFGDQGEWVPRTYLLTPNGRVMNDVEIATRGYVSFLGADDPTAFVRVMRQGLRRVHGHG